MITTLAFDQNAQTPIPKKIAEIPAGRLARVKIQVLDASTVFLCNSRDTAAQLNNNIRQGLQLTQASGIYSDWWAGGDSQAGEIWAVGSINNATIDVEVDILPAGLFGRGGSREVTHCAQCGSES